MSFKFGLAPSRELRIPEHDGPAQVRMIQVNRVELDVDLATGAILGLPLARCTVVKKNGEVGKVNTTAYLTNDQIPKWFRDEVQRTYEETLSEVSDELWWG